MAYIVGHDPGGAGSFGWAVVRDGPELPLAVVGTDVANNASEALVAVQGVVQGQQIDAVGIDAPLYWTTTTRHVDNVVRREIRRLGAQSGTVASPNSLQGACVVQGPLIAALMVEAYPAAVITEAHPKALLWMLTGRDPRTTQAADLRHFEPRPGANSTEHERDALLGALTAWAALHAPPDWVDIAASEAGTVYVPLVGKRPQYWMPIGNP